MSDERIIRVSQAIAAQMGGTTFEKLAQAMLEAVPEVAELDRLTEHLHKERAHPDWEYTVTVTGRKTNEEGRPDGEGWEPNSAMFAGRHWDRDDYTENNHWRRPISFLRAEQDAVHRIAERDVDNLSTAAEILRAKATVAQADMADNPDNWGGYEGTEQYRWNRAISNALGGPEMPAWLSPATTLILVHVMETMADQVSRTPERRNDDDVRHMVSFACQILTLQTELARKPL